MLDIFYFILLGILAGTFTGLIPGIHPNTLIVLLLSFLPFLLNFLSLDQLVAFVVAMSVTHTFTSFLSSCLIGVPEEETCLSLDPSKKFVLRGEILKAIDLTIYGGLYSTLFLLIFLPFILILFPILYPLCLKIMSGIIPNNEQLTTDNRQLTIGN